MHRVTSRIVFATAVLSKRFHGWRTPGGYAHAASRPAVIAVETATTATAPRPLHNNLVQKSLLNDILHAGPVIQSNLTIQILKLLYFQYVFSADITKCIVRSGFTQSLPSYTKREVLSLIAGLFDPAGDHAGDLVAGLRLGL